MTISYLNPFTGQTIQPSQIGYELIAMSVNTALQWPINGNNSDVVANIIEVTASTTGLKLIMPAATQVSTGQSILIRNVGANTVTVVKNDGTGGAGATIVTVASGIAQYIYITDNTTIPGTWSTVTFGAGTSAANAADLAGYGLTAISSTLNQAYTVTNVYSTDTIVATKRAQFVVYGGGVGTLTLPSAASVGNNWFCMIRNSGTGILTIAPVGTDTIDGNNNQQLQLTESLVIVSDGSKWNTFGYGQSVQFAFTQLVLSVTGGTATLSTAQAANIIQEYTGILASNQNVVFPSTVQLYAVTNSTTGSFSLTFKTSAVGGATFAVPQGTNAILICDGTNVYNATSATSSSINTLTLGNGSLATPSLRFAGDVNSGMYLPSSSQVGFVIANSLAGYFNASGFTAVNGISGGTF
jgi:hypothetical protein